MSSNQMDASLLGKIAGYTEILAKDPHSTIFVPLCEAYRQMGLVDDALDIALKGVQALPNFSPGYTALARIHAQRGEVDQAVSAYEQALARDEESLAALRGLARLRLQRGERAAARRLLERVAALDPDDAAVRKALASFGNAGSGAPQAPSPAVATTETGTGRTPRPGNTGGPISTPTIAEIYIRQGFPKRALKVYRDLLATDPHNETIRQKLVALKEQIAAEATPVEEAPPGGAAAAPSGYAGVLHRWLDAIQERRGDVR